MIPRLCNTRSDSAEFFARPPRRSLSTEVVLEVAEGEDEVDEAEKAAVETLSELGAVNKKRPKTSSRSAKIC